MLRLAFFILLLYNIQNTYFLFSFYSMKTQTLHRTTHIVSGLLAAFIPLSIASAQAPVGAYEVEDVQREIGQVVEDAAASEGTAIEALEGRSGFMALRSEQTLPAGSYTVTVHAATEAESSLQNILVIDVVAGERVLVNRTIRADELTEEGYTPVTVALQTGVDTADVQYRVQSLGAANVRVDKVTVEETPVEVVGEDIAQTPAPTTYEAEGLFSRIGRIVSDADASNGKAVRSVAGETGFIAFGPYTTERVEGGDKLYEATFFLRFDSVAHPGALAIADVHEWTTNTSSRSVIFAEDLEAGEGYQRFSIVFAAPDKGQLEYRVETLGVTGVTFDRVEVAESK